MKTFPKVVRIEPSSLCNLKCRHCPTGTTKSKGQLMKKELFEKVLKEIKQNINSVKVVVLYHSGEPFLNPNLEEMIEKLKKAGVEKIKMDSNGMLLTKKKSVKIIEAGLDELFVSLDGASKEENNFVRRGSDYKTIVENVRTLCYEKIKKKSQTPKVVLCNVNFFRGNLKKIKRSFNGFDVSFVSYNAIKWPALKVNKNLFSVFKIEKDYPSHCDHVVSTFTICSNGIVVPCCYDLKQFCKMGNIYKSSIREIWNNEKYKKLRTAIKKKENLPLLCKNCKVLGLGEYLVLKRTLGGRKNE